jgi:hypothetical protein
MPHGLVVDVATSADGRWVALAEPGGYLRSSSTLELIDVDSFWSGQVGFFGDAGLQAPSCISGWPAAADSQTTAVAFDDSGKLYAFSREPAALQVYAAPDPLVGVILVPQREIALALESVRDTRHELFHADVGGGLSCAGCHGEALDDGHVWNFTGFGGRRTQTMRGGLLSTLPLHWEGDLPTFQNLVDEVMTRRMGGFAVEPKYGEALAQWLDKLSTSVVSSTRPRWSDRRLFDDEEPATTRDASTSIITSCDARPCGRSEDRRRWCQTA